MMSPCSLALVFLLVVETSMMFPSTTDEEKGMIMKKVVSSLVVEKGCGNINDVSNTMMKIKVIIVLVVSLSSTPTCTKKTLPI